MELLLPFACDVHGDLVSISNAVKGEKYACPICGEELLLRNGDIRRAHFAHRINTNNHCSESFLHKLFKEKCAEYLLKKISNKNSFVFYWSCVKCTEKHHDNLLANISSVVVEKDLGNCRPDISLLNDKGFVAAVIEVVVSHKPDESVLNYYTTNKINCLQIKVKDFSDCEQIEKKLSNPDKVNISCPNPVCKRCGRVMHSSKNGFSCDSCEREKRLEQNKREQEKRLKVIYKNPFDTRQIIRQFMENYIKNTNCPKCGGVLRVVDDWCGSPLVKCECCDYKMYQSAFDGVIFPSMK